MQCNLPGKRLFGSRHNNPEKGANMRKILLLSAAALAVVATPAAARDGSGYFGIEGGVLFPKDMDVEGEFLFEDPETPDFLENDVAQVEFNRGLDLDAIAGFDFGAFRVEG